jgi:hypothetical protein
MLYDGPMDVVRPANGVSTFALCGHRGSILKLTPGQVNRIWVLKRIYPGGLDLITETVTATLKYWPAYLTAPRPA